MNNDSNNILVIGNGFDLALNYDTRYSDFISFVKIICLEKEVEYNPDDKHTKDLIDRINISKDKIFKDSNTRRLIECTKNNCLINHFTSADYDLNVWSDVEEEIYKIIKSINGVFNDDNLNSPNTIINTMDNKIYYAEYDSYTKEVLSEFNLIYSEVFEFKNNVKIYELNKEYYDYIYKIKWNVLIKHLIKQLDEFKEALIIYLKDFVPMIKSMYCDSVVEDQLARIKVDTIITFNYTNYYENVYEIDGIHVHGELKKNNIVLGFGEDKSLSLNYIRFFKYFQRIQNKLRLIKRNDDILLSYTKAESYDGILIPSTKKKNIIHFYGTSFDKTDEDYIKEIYGDEESNNKIYVYYYDSGDFDRKITNLISIFDKDIITNDIYREKLVMVPIKRES